MVGTRLAMVRARLAMVGGTLLLQRRSLGVASPFPCPWKSRIPAGNRIAFWIHLRGGPYVALKRRKCVDRLA